MRIVLIGFGYWGPNIARNSMASENIELVGICDASNDRLRAAQNIYGTNTEYFTDYKPLLKRNDIDGFALAVKNDVGQKIAEDILSAGKHLFMEKPLAKSVENAIKLKELAEKNRVTLHVDHVMVYHPYIQAIKEIFDSGEAGDLVYFESIRTNLGPTIKKDINAMWDLAVHDLAVVDYLSGGKEAEKVEALGVSRYGEKEEQTYLLAKYAGFSAMIKSSWISPLKERRILIGGTKKLIVLDELAVDKIKVYDKGFDLVDVNGEYGEYEAKMRNGGMYSPITGTYDALRRSLETFAEAARTGKKTVTGADQAIRVIRILEEADADM